MPGAGDAPAVLVAPLQRVRDLAVAAVQLAAAGHACGYVAGLGVAAPLVEPGSDQVVFHPPSIERLFGYLSSWIGLGSTVHAVADWRYRGRSRCATLTDVYDR